MLRVVDWGCHASLTAFYNWVVKLSLFLSDRHKIFTSDWLWNEVCQSTVFSKIDITMTTVNIKLWNLAWNLEKPPSRVKGHVYVVIQFHPWFKFYFLLFLGMVMYDNDFETTENKI